MMTKFIPVWKTSFSNGEAKEIAKSIKSQHISQGPVVEELELRLAKFLNVPYVVATTSGSIAILMSLLSINIQPGDEIIVPNRSWIASAHAPFLLGAKIILIDVDPNKPIINANLIESKITKKTKAIMPVHMGGRASDMYLINKLAKKYKLYVIEDAAQALGSKNQFGFLGTQSDLGCFSFSVAKIISTGQGGFIATKRKDLYEKLKLIRTQGVGDVKNAIWNIPGLNFRFTDILATIGIIQLSLIDSRIDKLKLIYKMYAEGLKNLDTIKLITVDLKAGEVPLYIEILCNKREELMSFLESHKVESRPFYPDLNTADYFKCSSKFIESLKYQQQGLYLPTGPTQNLSDIKRVIRLIKKFDK